MSSDGKDESQGGKAAFSVTDRRIFADDKGTARVEESPAPPAKPAAAAGAPAIDFHTFVLSLGSSALLHLGELERPDAPAAEKDLPMAKHTIDILAMLEEKTRGNLTPEEAKLLESLLFDLRLRYVEARK
ncbi:MAG TPA: DUF1844 domain-containing protein [Polyangia bacterium]|jgi:hypothetical protein|nr:DUF1844 domain-containing protein [Polyangia bacterium]